jgi:hypothetical protein
MLKTPLFRHEFCQVIIVTLNSNSQGESVKTNAAQQSVHWTLGFCRIFKHFLASSFFCFQTESTPAQRQ